MAELDDLIDRLTGDLRGIVGLRQKMKTATEPQAVPPPPPPPEAPSEDDIAKVKQIIADAEGNIKALKEKLEEHEKKAQGQAGAPGSAPAPKSTASASSRG